MADQDRTTRNEDDYFAREEIEKKRALALRQSEEMAAKQREELKALHYMKCPKCGMTLQTLKRGDVEIDTCFNCHGVWLDAGELEQLQKTDENDGVVMKAVLNLFKKK